MGLLDLFKKPQKADNTQLSKEEIAKLLKTNVAALEKFEESYRKNILSQSLEEDLFAMNAKMAAEMKDIASDQELPEEMIQRIVNELLAQTSVYQYDGKKETILSERDTQKHFLIPEKAPVTQEEISMLPPDIRPQLTGTLMKKDLPADSSEMLLLVYKKYLEETNPEKKIQFYHRFRQGLDILDLDPLLYKMIGTNPNSMGYWLPALVKAVRSQETIFKIPATTVIKVPLSLLQLTRVEYSSLTPTTLRTVDEYCKEVFELDEEKEYFIKTGTYSSKFDFRNAYVHGAKEVRELGEYLLFIHFQALQMAGPLSKPSIYGVSTTNEWAVREFIPDKEQNPTIYKGLPLHTEYRLFVDFDTNEVLGMNPYWDPKVMKKRFGHSEDSDSPHQIHDYIIYQMHEETLMERYEKNKDLIRKELQKLLPDVELSGQWSIDVMQNGEDFWIIDMALAKDSALVECVPKGLLKKREENWLPEIKE